MQFDLAINLLVTEQDNSILQTDVAWVTAMGLMQMLQITLLILEASHAVLHRTLSLQQFLALHPGQLIGIQNAAVELLQLAHIIILEQLTSFRSGYHVKHIKIADRTPGVPVDEPHLETALYTAFHVVTLAESHNQLILVADKAFLHL